MYLLGLAWQEFGEPLPQQKSNLKLSGIISSRSFSYIQIRDTDLYQEWHLRRRFRRLRLIHHLTIHIEHLIPRILICTLL